jgi:histidinol-phosphatase (PHP family)
MSKVVPFDLHLHTRLSEDGEGTIEGYCEKALEMGMSELGFTEHVDLCPTDPHYNFLDYERYRGEISAARARYQGRLAIRMGMEVTYLPSIAKDISDYLEGKDFDYLIGAIHLLDEGAGCISEQEPAHEYFKTRDPVEVYENYFELVLEMVRSGLFDVLAHLDLINRYGLNYLGKFEYGRFYGLLRRILEGAIKRDMALELNASGLRKNLGQPHPHQDILKMYYELDGQLILLGSDAHSPGNLGACLDEAVEIATRIGLNTFVSFEGRMPVYLESG